MIVQQTEVQHQLEKGSRSGQNFFAAAQLWTSTLSNKSWLKGWNIWFDNAARAIGVSRSQYLHKN